MQSTYEERIKQTPKEKSGRWYGARGESLCRALSDEAKKILNKKGLDGIQYRDGMPDFGPVSEATVELGYMTRERNSKGMMYGRDDKQTSYWHKEDPKSVGNSKSMSGLMMKYEEPGNFQQADILTAEKWSGDKKDGKAWSASDVAQYRKDNKLTWHECNDGKTMQLVPTAINSDFGHLGGVSETAKRKRVADDITNNTQIGLTDDTEVDAIKKMNDKELRAHMRKKERNQDQPQISDKTKGEDNMDKKAGWDKYLQEQREATKKYQAEQMKQKQQQAKNVNGTSSSGATSPNDSRAERSIPKKKNDDHYMSR